MPERLSAWEGRYHKVKIEYGQQIQEAFDLEDEGRKAEEPRNRAAWARMMAAETRKQAMDRSKNVKQSNGEAVPPSAEKFIHDVLTIPDLASVQASLDRNRLLLQSGTDVAAMALDAALSIQANNSLEKMLARQLAAAHKAAMDQLGQLACESNSRAQVKRLNAAARCMIVYQQGLLTPRKFRRSGDQRICVQHIHMSEGSQAVIGDIVQGTD